MTWLFHGTIWQTLWVLIDFKCLIKVFSDNHVKQFLNNLCNQYTVLDRRRKTRPVKTQEMRRGCCVALGRRAVPDGVGSTQPWGLEAGWVLGSLHAHRCSLWRVLALGTSSVEGLGVFWPVFLIAIFSPWFWIPFCVWGVCLLWSL